MERRVGVAGPGPGGDLQRVNWLRRFLVPQLVDVVINSGNEDFLRSHRREIVVVFCDLRFHRSPSRASLRR